MLAIGSKHSQKKEKAVLIAKDKANSKNIYWLPDSKDKLPTQKICGDPLKMLDEEEMLRVFKKYSLSKKQIQGLLEFYKDPDLMEIDFDSDWKLKCAFNQIEKMIIKTLKTTYLNPCSDIIPHFDPSRMHGQAFVGPTRSGKTYAMCQVLLQDQFASTKVYVFTLNEHDPSIALLKKRKKSKTVFIDLKKIDPNRQLRLRRDCSPDSILVFDDVMELPRSDPLRANLINLMNETLSRGRHHKSRKDSNGCSAMVAAHHFRSGMDSKTLWNEVSYLTIYRSSSPHKSYDFLTKTLNIHRKDVQRIFEMSEGCRSICFHVSGKPMYAAWATGICLL